MTKPWPQRVPKKDPEPDDFLDLSVETKRLVAHGEHLYFFVWCQDMDDFDNQLSVLFRVHRSFDQPAERLASIKTEMVDLCLYDGALIALENGEDDNGGFGVVHRLVPGASKPESSTRFAEGHVYATLGLGPQSTLFAAGGVVQRFDGKKWHATTLPEDAKLTAIGGNGDAAVAVGKDGLVLALEANGEPRVIAEAKSLGPDYDGVHVAADGIVSIAGGRGCLQGPLEKLAPLAGVPEDASFNDTCIFQGKRYWSAVGDEGVGGLYVQSGTGLQLVFDRQSCFQLTPTDDYLFVAAEAGILRFDGKDEWKAVSTNYDEDASVWVMLPGDPEEAHDGDEDDEEDD